MFERADGLFSFIGIKLLHLEESWCELECPSEGSREFLKG